MIKKEKRLSGFTLIEMSVVIFIIGILLLLIMPKIGAQKNSARRIGGEAFSEVVQTQADLYKSDTGDSVVSLDQLYEKNYLNKKQYEKAKAEKIVIDSDEETK
ncbi:competence type IV pilus major pilin ComGC [Lactobacillus sp. UCMA15818]|uniref:competence type IV pilus major pilin ComGC n=1 Tax=Lactobacillaceae TaxID=33958 RepID=UPI0025B005E4|nr:competence type IV pilus major pilin ComGC [Lactobacillus sp. UCMA15818]MDN2454230.1 prepilin-type N-terminal cleavage/methylation domain-containing protein [Lactobacillus sp. UCMA15818]